MSPVASCDTKVHFMDVIDIASIPDPKPRAISLEPISRRGRAKTPRKLPQLQESTLQIPDGVESTRSGRLSELNSVTEEGENPGSPAPSDTSFESQISSGNASGTEYGVRSVNTALDSTLNNANRAKAKGKIITATIEVSKGGFLRGDSVPLKVTVNHTKHVRSLKGIIITLYRQARVDMHPALPVLPNSKNDKAKSEDYYPKSRTGLGGLSLSSAGSSHLFRKDLSQSFAPLFVDPRTLTAEVKCAVRVPDEAFPTISNVPGAMISFKYFVEVVVDIQGKFSGLDRMLPSLVPIGNSSGMGGLGLEDASGGMFSSWGGNFADTDSIRREKGVVSSLFEVVIGTKDSERSGKRKAQSADIQAEVQEIQVNPTEQRPIDGDQRQELYGYDEDPQYWEHYGYEGVYDEAPGYHDSGSSQVHYTPRLVSEEGLSEKERMRRAEARLLPSQPPREDGPSTSLDIAHGIPPSAPILPEDEDSTLPYLAAEASTLASGSSAQPPPSFATATSIVAAASSLDITTAPALPPSVTDDDVRTTITASSLTVDSHSRPSPPLFDNNASAPKPSPSLPIPSPTTVPDYFPSSSAHVRPTDDKQELQHRRLELERSAPPTDDAEEASSPRGLLAPLTDNVPNTLLAPSAPVLDDDDEGLVSAVRPSNSLTPSDRRGSEQLPGYER